MPTISANTARATLRAQLDRASGVWNAADRVDELLQSARSAPLRGPALEPDRADELVQAARRGPA